MQITIPGGFETVTWYGRGPQETYWDRKSGARVGLYSGSVDEQFVDYCEPQENGNKTDVRWLAADQRRRHRPDGGWRAARGFSVHHFTAGDIESQARVPDRAS